MPGATRSLTDFFSFFGRRPSEVDASPSVEAGSQAEEPLFPTKALTKFLKHLQSRENPAIINLGPVVGSNVTFFGEQLGCRIRVEDVAADIERHVKAQNLEELPRVFESRFPLEPASVDGILCWDLLDYLDRPAALALASSLSRLLKPDGTLLGFFSTAETRTQVYTKYIIVDHANLRYRTYPASRPRQRALLNRDIIKLFEGLRVTDSFLMKTHMREILFRKPPYLTGAPYKSS